MPFSVLVCFHSSGTSGADQAQVGRRDAGDDLGLEVRVTRAAGRRDLGRRGGLGGRGRGRVGLRIVVRVAGTHRDQDTDHDHPQK
ncbi:hypothetical protein G5V59_00425 [Nocardioides sp. W3-2-3]|uniref:hypothetical protein n=1 Tax=Nocardioides convexus TaxID=2712224 RepID=UPI0024185233|nr:hypothetical protein [Nocardioides convexus]NGZ99434.1 hypothetical protein [Nocardioides convexus]